MWFIDFLDTVVKRRKFIILNTLAVTILVAIICFLLPSEYKSRTTILPPESQSGFSAFSDLSVAQIAQAVTSFNLPVLASPSDLYASMLESDAVLEHVVDSLDLVAVYKTKTTSQAITELRLHQSVKVEPDGIIVVEIDDRNPERAAEIANMMIEELNTLNISIQRRKSGQHVDFLTRRLVDTELELQNASDELRRFQEENMAISLELQSAALIDNLTQHKAELTSAEIQLEILKKSLRPDHPDLLRKQRTIVETRRKLKEIEMGAETKSDSVISALDIPLAKIPDLSLRFAVLKRNVKIQELIYEIIAQQLEMSRIQERRDMPVINVLDIAKPPQEPYSPRRLLIIASALLLSFFLSILLVLWYERIQSGEGSLALQRARDIATELRKKPLG